MKILSCKLVNYKPLYLSNIYQFDYTVEQLLQLILGTNGSGKSKLLEILSPLPADVKKFDKNGSKVIRISNNGSVFVLSSVIDGNGKGTHSFYNETEDEELNNGGTITIQKQLVSRVFKYTDFIHKILTGKLKITAMSPMMRKELIFAVANIDLTFALDIFDRVTRDLRDTQGAIKHIASKIMDLGTGIMSKDEHDSLSSRKLLLDTEIHELTKQHNPMFTSISILEGKVVNELSRLEIVAGERFLKTIKDSMGTRGITSIEHANELCINREVSLGMAEKEVASLLSSLDTVNNLSARLNNCPEDIKEDNIDIRIQDLETELKDFNGVGGILEYNPVYLITLPKVREELARINDYTEEGIQVYTLTEIYEIEHSEETAAHNLTRLSKDLQVKTKHLSEFELAAHSDVECTQCGFLNLGEGSAPERIKAALKRDIGIIDEHIVIASALVRDCKEESAKVDLFKLSLSNLRTIYSKHGFLSRLWEGVKPYEIISNTSLYLTSIAIEINRMNSLEERQAVLNKLAKLREYKEVLEISKGLGDVSITELEERYSKSVDSMEVIKKDYDSLFRFVTDYKRLTSVVEHNEYHRTNTLSLISDLAESEMDSTIRDRLNELHESLFHLDKHLTKAINNKDILASLEQDLIELTFKQDSLSILTKALSPKTGIIGDALRAVCENFTDDINSAIGEIWEYEMIVNPYDNPTNLTFKFPLVVKGRDIGEISEGSDGQKDVIDVATTLCVMDYMDINNYPMFMDEVGKTFDKAHQTNFMQFVSKMITTGRCSQMFMVSHYASQYGGLSNADYVVLNPDNIIVPTKFNEHVTMS